MALRPRTLFFRYDNDNLLAKVDKLEATKFRLETLNRRPAEDALELSRKIAALQNVKVVEKPWGCEQILELNTKYCVKLITVKPSQSLSRQYHEVKHETMYCLSGTGMLKTDSSNIELWPDQSVVIPPKMVHRLVADPGKDLVILEVSTPELDDVIRLEDQYGRV